MQGMQGMQAGGTEVRSVRDVIARSATGRGADRDPRDGQRGRLTGEALPSPDAYVAIVEEALLVLGRRWRPSILCLLLAGPQRYNALLRQLPGATPKMLTQQLKALEAAGLVDRIAFSGGARRTEYALSPTGEALRTVLDALQAWATAPPSRRAEYGGHPEREVASTLVAHGDTESRRVGYVWR
jgi:DNA-binding HxlR family transcriptional regulator